MELQMNPNNPLIGIAARTNFRAGECAPAFDFTSLTGDDPTFCIIQSALLDKFPALKHKQANYDESAKQSIELAFISLVDQLQHLPQDPAERSSAIIKILALSTLIDHEDQLWPEVLKANILISNELIDALIQAFIESHVDSDSILKTSLDKRMAKSFKQQLIDRDWQNVEYILEHLWWRIRSRLKASAGVALFHLAPNALRSAIERMNEFFDVISYVFHTPSHHHLENAIAVNNWTFKFWTLQQSARRASAGMQSFSSEWEELLVQASQDPDEWAMWMSALNRYPSRYPQLQPSVGRALGRVPAEALEGYVTVLQMNDHSRSETTQALHAFRTSAPETVRKAFWTIAFNRWRNWDFGTRDDAKILFDVRRCSLDYAVVGYFIECANSCARSAYTAELIQLAWKLEHDWYPGQHSAITDRFKLISAYQVLAHAESVASTQASWLPSSSLYRPPWEDGSLYRSFKFDVDLPRPTFLAEDET